MILFIDVYQYSYKLLECKYGKIQLKQSTIRDLIRGKNFKERFVDLKYFLIMICIIVTMLYKYVKYNMIYAVDDFGPDK